MKRLTPQERAESEQLLRSYVALGDVGAEGTAILEILDDAAQRHEDVARLLAALRQLAPYRRNGTGAYCWCHPDQGPCFRSEDGAPTQPECRTLNALEGEVGQ